MSFCRVVPSTVSTCQSSTTATSRVLVSVRVGMWKGSSSVGPVDGWACAPPAISRSVAAHAHAMAHRSFGLVNVISFLRLSLLVQRNPAIWPHCEGRRRSQPTLLAGQALRVPRTGKCRAQLLQPQGSAWVAQISTDSLIEGSPTSPTCSKPFLAGMTLPYARSEKKVRSGPLPGNAAQTAPDLADLAAPKARRFRLARPSSRAALQRAGAPC